MVSERKRGFSSLFLVCILLALSRAGRPREMPSCSVPEGSHRWLNDPEPVLTVGWSYGKSVCTSVHSCYETEEIPDGPLVPQLFPSEVQQGVRVLFRPQKGWLPQYSLTIYQVTTEAFLSCNTTEGKEMFQNSTADDWTLTETDLAIGSNYFIAGSDYSPLIRCDYGLRLNLTVKESSSCRNDSRDLFCQGHGNCVTRKLEASYRCACCEGYQGDRCQYSDPCNDRPCHNGGTCTYSEGDATNFTCACPTDYSGTLCEDAEIGNPCLSHVCDNNGTCVQNGTNATCACLPGFSGGHCLAKKDNCYPNPCAHGICVDHPDGFKCFCVPGYYGHHCEEEYDECQSDPCSNGGECQDKLNGFECHCKKGYKGRTCEIIVNFCQPNPCRNARKCVNGAETFHCVCKPGFSGIRCDMNINECLSQPCLNGATCHDLVNGFHCTCGEVFVGDQCQYTVDFFAPQPIENRPFGFRDSAQVHRIRSLYILGGTLGGAVVIVLVVLGGCYCRLHRTYNHVWHRNLRYRKHQDECTKLTLDISSVNKPQPSMDTIWEATMSSGYQENDWPLPSVSSVKPLQI